MSDNSQSGGELLARLPIDRFSIASNAVQLAGAERSGGALLARLPIEAFLNRGR